MSPDLTQGGPIYGPFISKAQALACGAKHYFTGKPCKKGHVSLRYTSVRSCQKCQEMHGKEFAKKNPEKVAAYTHKFYVKDYAANPEKYKARDQARKSRHKTPKFLAQKRAYYAKNREHRCAYIRAWTAKIRKEKPSFAFAADLRSLIGTAIKKQWGAKAHKTQILIGCSVEQLMMHLESQFVDGMTWKNHGRNGWHIDHIRPCASFDLTDPEQQRECFHYSNLQPLWAADNISKSDKWEPVAA